jgi:alkyldihydroxyacetonephosphate synthase
MLSVEQMKWWGWGGENIEFNMNDKPELWPYIKDVVGIEGEIKFTPSIKFEDIELPPQTLNDKFINRVKSFIDSERFMADKKERLIHSYGKSFRDLWRIRNGIVNASPDCVIYPLSEDEILNIIKTALDFDVVVIPFGAGSNIAGCLEANNGNGRMIVSLDMKLMDKVISVDKQSNTARIQAGAMGPLMEKQLNSYGFTLGHFPDSFEYSTIGGWIATRSAGMQSDKYGKIEDMLLSLRMVTPTGTIVTRTVPKSSNGIDVNHICIGSEGTLGVITEAVVQVHKLPDYRVPFGFLFPDFESGVNAVYECVEKYCPPVVTRLNDPCKTALSFAYRSKSSPIKSLLGKVVKSYLKDIKKFDFDKACLMLNVFEGDKENFTNMKKKVNRIYKKYGAFNLGTEPGKAFEKGKYDFPYLRDYVMDRNIMADVSETSTVWSNLLPLYYSTIDSINKAMNQTVKNGFLGCHISHTYHTGASLYFTFGCQQIPGYELEQYLSIKKAAEDAFIKGGATLSHHHAVGFEHMPWIKDDISETGIRAVRGLKNSLDPNNIMNPDKIIPSIEKPFNWGLEKVDFKNIVPINMDSHQHPDSKSNVFK